MPDSPTRHAITIAARFCGPPGSANGGYAAGLLASAIPGPAEVTLRAPPPLERPLALAVAGDGGAELLDGERLVASARPQVPVPVDIAVPTFEEAIAAAGRTLPAERHGLPGCFVCGPAREEGDGLRLQVGPVDAAGAGWSGTLAAPWIPGEDLADTDGRVRPEFVWAALDCPTAYACADGTTMPPILLGRQTVAIERCPDAGERCIVVARRRNREGRKYFADAALASANGRLLASCNAVWIEVDPAVLAANS